MANRKDSRNRVLRNGETERKDGRYMFRYTDKKTGQRKTIYAKDLPELREKEKSVLSDVENNIRTDGNVKSLTVNNLFQHYLEIKEISESTKVNYRSAWKCHMAFWCLRSWTAFLWRAAAFPLARRQTKRPTGYLIVSPWAKRQVQPRPWR